MDTKNITAREAAQHLDVDVADVNFGMILVPAEVRDHLKDGNVKVLAPDELNPELLEEDDIHSVAQLAATNLHRGIDLQGEGVLIPVWSAPSSGTVWGYALVDAGEISQHSERVAELLEAVLEGVIADQEVAHLEIGDAVREAAEATSSTELKALIAQVDAIAQQHRDKAREHLEVFLQKEALGQHGQVNLTKIFELPEPELFEVLALVRASSPGNLLEALADLAGLDRAGAEEQVEAGLEWSRWNLETLETVTRIGARLPDSGEFRSLLIDEPHTLALTWEKWTVKSNTPELRIPENLAGVALDELAYGTPALTELTSTDPVATVAGALWRAQKNGEAPDATAVAAAFERLTPQWRTLMVRADTQHWMLPYLKSLT